MITITEEMKKMIEEGEGKYKNLLFFRRLTDGVLYPRYVKPEEETEEIIKKCTSDIHYMGTNIGTLLELVYNHDYIINIEKIPFDRIYDIKQGTFGYIDPEGAFYPIGNIDNHIENFRHKNMAGKIASNIVLSLNITEEEKEKFKKEKQYFMETRFSRYDWPADRILKENGFCLFFRGINDEDYYTDQSYYKNANEKQLIVLSYLYTLNHSYDMDLEATRKILIKRCIEYK